MPKLTPEQKLQFREYVEAARGAEADLEFLLEHLDASPIAIDHSVSSLEALEALYWRFLEREDFPEELGTLDDFLGLLCRYLGQCIIACCGGAWVQSAERNGQPCIDGFGNEPWDRIYPAAFVDALPDLPRLKPYFPGARERRLLAAQLERALKNAGRAVEPRSSS